MENKYLIVGDIHSCFIPLRLLLLKVGIDISNPITPLINKDINGGRIIISVGDLCDRGPFPSLVLDAVMSLTKLSLWKGVSGNHDNKMLRHLKGNEVTLSHGLDGTITKLNQRGPEFKAQVKDYLETLPLFIKDDNLLVCHAAYKDNVSPKYLQSLCLYGETTGKYINGFPERKRDWEDQYNKTKVLVHGHTVVPEVELTKNLKGSLIVNVDTGCYDSGKLSGLLYPEMKIINNL